MLSGRASFDSNDSLRVGASRQRAVERVIAAMRERIDGALSLGAMAEIAHLSPFRFVRVFRGITGIPPGEFLGALRLERAKQLLLTTDLSVSEVCFEVGYNSLGTFATRFKQLVGVQLSRMRSLPEELASALEASRESNRSPGSCRPSHTPSQAARSRPRQPGYREEQDRRSFGWALCTLDLSEKNKPERSDDDNQGQDGRGVRERPGPGA